jgi:hypothetical protein
MTRSFRIPFAGVLAVFGLAQPALGDHTCAQFDVPLFPLRCCVSAKTELDLFTQVQVEALGGVYLAGHECVYLTGDCIPKSGVNPEDYICSAGCPGFVCSALDGNPAPVVSGWGLALMALAVGGAGTAVIRRRRRPA